MLPMTTENNAEEALGLKADGQLLMRAELPHNMPGLQDKEALHLSPLWWVQTNQLRYFRHRFDPQVHGILTSSMGNL